MVRLGKWAAFTLASLLVAVGLINVINNHTVSSLEIASQTVDTTRPPDVATSTSNPHELVCWNAHGSPLPQDIRQQPTCPPCWTSTPPANPLPLGTADPCEVARAAPAPQPVGIVPTPVPVEVIHFTG